jgi:hypothetical protein
VFGLDDECLDVDVVLALVGLVVSECALLRDAPKTEGYIFQRHPTIASSKHAASKRAIEQVENSTLRLEIATA